MAGPRRASHRIKILLAILAMAVVALLVLFGDVRSAYQAGRVQQAIEARDWPKAIALLDRFPAKSKETARWHFQRAKAARRSGDSSTAVVHLARAEELGWPKPEVGRQRLLIRAQTNIREVEGELRQAALQGGTDEEAEEIYEAMSRGYMHALRFPDAMDCLNYWGQWQPSNPLPHLWKADLYERKELPEEAAAEYELALQSDSTNEEARLKLAQVRLKQLNVPVAAALFQQSLGEGENLHRALLGLADCKRRQSETAEARALLHEVLLLDLSAEDESEACAALARIEREEGRLERALALFSRALVLNPNDIVGRLAFAGALAAAGQDQLAEQQRKLAKEMSDRHERLLEVLKKIEQTPENPDLRYQAGKILLEQGLVETGLQWLDTALQLDPQHADSLRARAEALAEPDKPIDSDHPRKGD